MIVTQKQRGFFDNLKKKEWFICQFNNFPFVLNTSRCTSIAWVPNSDGTFVVAHADGNFYVYDKVNIESKQCVANFECSYFQLQLDQYASFVVSQSKDGSADPSFPIVKDQTQFSVSHARYSKVLLLIDVLLFCRFNNSPERWILRNKATIDSCCLQSFANFVYHLRSITPDTRRIWGWLYGFVHQFFVTYVRLISILNNLTCKDIRGLLNLILHPISIYLNKRIKRLLIDGRLDASIKQ